MAQHISTPCKLVAPIALKHLRYRWHPSTLIDPYVPKANLPKPQTQKLNMTLILHCGAGKYGNRDADDAFVSLMNRALQIGLDLLADPQTAAADVVALTLAELERSPLTNAGFGSNLTRNGTVECDSGIAWMPTRNESPSFAAIGAAPGLESPSQCALELLKETEKLLETMPSMSPTRFIVGRDAWIWAHEKGLSIAKDEADLARHHVTARAISAWNAARERLDLESYKRQRCDDTIGCICIDQQGRIAVGCSSGGPVFRPNGRVGPAAMFGIGFYVTTDAGVCTTGSSDFISRNLLARVATEVKDLSDLLPKSNGSDQVGIIRLRKGDGQHVVLDWAFNSPGLAVGYANIKKRSSEVLRCAADSAFRCGSMEIHA